MGLALALIAVGLLSSTLHLGRPERAWRALSQWRTSWLSREGVLAIATFVPAGLLGLLWGFTDGRPPFLFALVALATIILALATVYATGMIYQSLPTVRAWHDPLVTPAYLLLALASGAVLTAAIDIAVGEARPALAITAIALLAAAALLKRIYWHRVDELPRTWLPETATGLGRFGKVRVLEQPHSQANYVMREMGYEVARTHAEKLRRTTLLFAFVVPAALLAIALAAGGGLAVAASIAAVIAMTFGLLTERWLFFAEAQHVVMTFYGAERA